jgi:hypothetical protein
VVGFVAAVAAGTSVFSCRQIVGIQDSPAGDPTNACGLPYGTPACATCASTNCCAESDACNGDPSCQALESCFGPCNGDPTCWAKCLNDHPATGTAVSALSACLATHCEAACGLTCGAFSGYTVPPDAATACQSCLVAKGCTPTRACATSADCEAIVRCNDGCRTIDCQDACERPHGFDPAYSWEPDAGPGGPYGAFTSAAIPACSIPCGLSDDWSCVGHVTWPSLKATSTTYKFWAKDYTTGLPVQGASVSVCGSMDIACAMPFTTGTTNSAGLVALTFQNAQDIGGQQNFGLNGYLMITSPSLVPNYYYWGFPLSEAEMDSYGLLLTPDEIDQILVSVGVTQDPGRGYVSVAVYSCAAPGGPAPAGVKVTLSSADEKTRGYTTSGAETDVTDSTGILIFNNVPAGNVTMTAPPMGLQSPSSTVTANVRKGATTTILAVPSP